MTNQNLQSVGKGCAATICEYVAALECDYDRLEELREIHECVAPDPEMDESQREEYEELLNVAGECTSREEAETRIQEWPLELSVRSGWHPPGWHLSGKDIRSEEFLLLLGTGGPATRIRGELDEHGEPRRAWLEVQDWGTPWTRYFDIDQEMLLTFARCFYFEEG
jgi:hypothetical protein